MKTRTTLIVIAAAFALAASASAQVSLTVDAAKTAGRIDPKVYGHFLEHIYHSCNGGLWGELVWDRSFEGGGAGAAWSVKGGLIAQEGGADNVRLTFGSPQWSDYEFTVEGPAHPAIKQTCLQLSASGVSDSGPGIIDECHLLAQVLDPSVIIPHWQCAMRDGCPEDGSYDYPPTGTVGNEYCNAVLGRGEKCEPAVKAYLNDIEVFFRTEAIDALKTCFGEPLSTQVNACTMAWISLLE